MLRDLFVKALDRHRSGDLAQAAQLYRAGLAFDPLGVGCLGNLGGALRDLGRLDEAAPLLHRALRLLPQEPLLYLNLGALLHFSTDPAGARACVRRAILLVPGLGEAYSNLGGSAQLEGDLETAEAAFRRALLIAPDLPEGHLCLSLLLLLTGRFQEGWEHFEWRWQTRQQSGERRDFAPPQWRGEPAEGKILLLHGEQGFGDTIQFSRYAARAAARGLRVIMEVQPPLRRLLASTPGCERVIGQGEALPDFDLHCPMMSMPLAVGTDIPPLVRLDAEAAALSGAGHKIGLVWAGKPRAESPEKAAFDRRRSLNPERLAPILAVPGCSFFSLQKGGPPIPAGAPITDLMQGIEDFAETASLIAALDLVISVDTSTAHLAASMGKPVWLMNRFDSDWRWGTEGEESPWYPTMRIFRQSSLGDWDGVIAAIAAAARDL